MQQIEYLNFKIFAEPKIKYISLQYSSLLHKRNYKMQELLEEQYAEV